MKNKMRILLMALSLLIALETYATALAEFAPVPTEDLFRLEDEPFGLLRVGMPEQEGCFQGFEISVSARLPLHQRPMRMTSSYGNHA